MTLSESQRTGAHYLCWIAGAVIGWRAWPKHYIVGAFIGSGVGSAVASVVLGEHPVIKKLREMRAAQTAGK